MLDDAHYIVSGFIGSYPNFFFAVEQNQLNEFVTMIKNAHTETDMDAVYNRFGIRRTNPEIWQHADWFNGQHPKYRGLEAGLFDMNRYKNL
ncbi:MAG: fatty acid cis/trans isomerase [Methylococcales bacterium]|nr:fatty acid cis/trans isomerase [Methylococcales bacterium]MDP3838652.1 fatty acid cis/trans isomerase [Methylococcales bacterium]